MKKSVSTKIAFIFSTLALSIMLCIIGIITYSISQGRSLAAVQSFAQAAIPKTVEYRLRSQTDSANEDGNLFNPLPQRWLGNGEFVSYLGLRFRGDTIPAGSSVESATVDLSTPSDSWISVGFQVAGEKPPVGGDFGSSSRPSSRQMTTSSYNYNDNVKWVKGTYYSYDVTRIVQEVISTTQTDTVTLIFRGTGSKWGRRTVETTPGVAAEPRLRITFSQSGGASATASPTPTTTPKVTASPTVRPTLRPTASPSPQNSLFPTPTATSRPTAAATHIHSVISATGIPQSQQVAGGESEALNAWGTNGKNRPNPQYNYCVYGTNLADRSQRVGMSGGARDDNDALAYVTQAHKRFRVQGPDGKWYPTWHKPVESYTENGRTITCAFGHEHGRDPKGSELWRTKQIQNYFYFDANRNGQMDSAEEAVSGLPFGYVNEQLVAYNASRGSSVMRHEDHVGHKVEYANGEGDIATHQSNNLLTGGVFVGRLGNGVMAKDTGVRCYYLAKPHQGVSSNDAFTNSIHEVFYFADCRHSNAAYNQKISIATIEAFGTPGGFTSFQPMCDVERRSSPQDFIFLGPDSMRTEFPSGDGDREIITRDCIERGFLVEAGR